jgi:hypothetical protein
MKYSQQHSVKNDLAGYPGGHQDMLKIEPANPGLGDFSGFI